MDEWLGSKHNEAQLGEITEERLVELTRGGDLIANCRQAPVGHRPLGVSLCRHENGHELVPPPARVLRKAKREAGRSWKFKVKEAQHRLRGLAIEDHTQRNHRARPPLRLHVPGAEFD
jgi:hypothetical protein